MLTSGDFSETVKHNTKYLYFCIFYFFLRIHNELGLSDFRTTLLDMVLAVGCMVRASLSQCSSTF